jgi:hypothetical protein
MVATELAAPAPPAGGNAWPAVLAVLLGLAALVWAWRRWKPGGRAG